MACIDPVPALRDPDPSGPRYSVQVPFELLRYSTDLPANALLPPREQGLGAVNVLVKTDYYFTTIRRSAQPSLLIASGTVFSSLLLALAEERRRRRRAGQVAAAAGSGA